MSLSPWSSFWENQKDAFYSIMQINTFFFAKAMKNVEGLKAGDNVLDYGCGPGLLSDALIAEGIEITGADINAFFIEQSKTKHPQSRFVHISSETTNTTSILERELGESKFDFIILLSIVQYFKDVNELAEVIRMLGKYTSTNGKIILGDIVDANTSALRDTISLFIKSVQTGKVVSFVRFIAYLLFSNYRNLSKQSKLLAVSEKEMHAIASHGPWKVAKVNGLTIHPSRTNYVFTRLQNQ